MKIVSVELGQATQLFVPEEIRPQRGTNIHELFRQISERYEAIPKNTPQEAIASGSLFSSGHCTIDDQVINIVEIGIWRDGIIVQAQNTSEADAVIGDLMQWAIDVHGYRRPQTKIPRRYVSNVIFEFDSSFDEAFARFIPFCRSLGNKLESYFHKAFEPVPFRLSFAANGQVVTASPPTEFTIERRQAFGQEQVVENRFWSVGQLRTSDHIELLKQFESALG